MTEIRYARYLIQAIWQKPVCVFFFLSFCNVHLRSDESLRMLLSRALARRKLFLGRPSKKTPMISVEGREIDRSGNSERRSLFLQ